MPYSVIYHPKVFKEDLPKISPAEKKNIQQVIEQRLLVDPVKYGLPLRRGLAGYRKLRTGDYRIIYRVVDTEIRIIIIGHKKNVYQKADQRKED